MKNLMNKNLSRFLQIFSATALIILYAGGSSSLFAQRARPANPQPTPPLYEVPTIISRDDEDSLTVEDDVNETAVSREADIKLPRAIDSKSGREEVDENQISAKQQKMMFYLDLLTRTEQRASSLRQQLYEAVEKQNNLSTKLKELEFAMRPESISGYAALRGSMRPEDVRDQRLKALELEIENTQTLLTQIEENRSRIEANLSKADLLVEKVRLKFDKIVDEPLQEEFDDLE